MALEPEPLLPDLRGEGLEDLGGVWGEPVGEPDEHVPVGLGLEVGRGVDGRPVLDAHRGQVEAVARPGRHHPVGVRCEGHQAPSGRPQREPLVYPPHVVPVGFVAVDGPDVPSRVELHGLPLVGQGNVYGLPHRGDPADHRHLVAAVRLLDEDPDVVACRGRAAVRQRESRGEERQSGQDYQGDASVTH